MQSSRKRFGLEHREGDLCWSLTESEGRKEKAGPDIACHTATSTAAYTGPDTAYHTATSTAAYAGPDIACHTATREGPSRSGQMDTQTDLYSPYWVQSHLISHLITTLPHTQTTQRNMAKESNFCFSVFSNLIPDPLLNARFFWPTRVYSANGTSIS